MASMRLDRWLPALVLVGAGTFIVITSWLDSVVTGIVLTALFAVFGWWSWPGRRGPHVSHRDAQESAAANDVIVYWRPG